MRPIIKLGIGVGLVAFALATEAATLKSASEGLYKPVAFLTVLMHYASYAVGAALVIGAIVQYRIHLQNPKITPLFTPIIMAVLGICAILLPYFANVFGNSWSATNQDATGNTGEVRRPQQPARPNWSEDESGTHSEKPTGSHWSDTY